MDAKERIALLKQAIELLEEVGRLLEGISERCEERLREEQHEEWVREFVFRSHQESIRAL